MDGRCMGIWEIEMKTGKTDKSVERLSVAEFEEYLSKYLKAVRDGFSKGQEVGAGDDGGDKE